MIGISLGNGTSITYRRDVSPVYTTGHCEYDHEWAFVDGEGHRHHWAPASGSDGHFPTLEAVYKEGGYCGTCDDVHGDRDLIDFWRCPECFEVVKPGTRWSEGETIDVLGPVEITLEGEVRITDPAVAQEMLDSGEAASMSGGLEGGWRVHVRKILTPGEAQALLDEHRETMIGRSRRPGRSR